MSIFENLKAEAKNLGFLLLGSSTPQKPTHWDVFQHWLGDHRHAGMDYLKSPRSLELRANPAAIMPDCQSVLSFALPYSSPLAPENAPYVSGGRVAAYAWGMDYHHVIPQKLGLLVDMLYRVTGLTIQTKIYTDSGPILEKDFAQSAGLGWMGKNTCLIHPRYGSFFFLAEILTDLKISPTPSFTADRCGSCARCVQACPTGAILPDRTLDSRRCISYLTIENKGEIPAGLRKPIGNWVFGCDICQEVCPWNQHNQSSFVDPAFQPQSGPLPLNLIEILTCTAQEYNHAFRESPLSRARRRGMLRNAAVVLGNQLNSDAIPALSNLLFKDPEPLIRAHAAWSLGQFTNPSARSALEKAFVLETTPKVCEEIVSALSGESLTG